MPHYRRKPTVIDAVQFTDATAPPRGVMFHHIFAKHFVTTIQGQDVFVSPGEWIVVEADGEHHYPIADATFRELYDPI